MNMAEKVARWDSLRKTLEAKRSEIASMEAEIQSLGKEIAEALGVDASPAEPKKRVRLTVEQAEEIKAKIAGALGKEKKSLRIIAEEIGVEKKYVAKLIKAAVKGLKTEGERAGMVYYR